ncbi:hypothetical protein [Paraburkholderia silvatlantica]|uniref:hypothetical protein n=1 Tax=Paraburkholderia silvatlantica TaxID=321895 RepID=UPI001FCBB509|nr:hypothetical protein [Paraburkholderia silvatlantica]
MLPCLSGNVNGGTRAPARNMPGIAAEAAAIAASVSASDFDMLRSCFMVDEIRAGNARFAR